MTNAPDTPAPNVLANDGLTCTSDNPLPALIDTMPPYLHGRVCAVSMFDPQWREIRERESALYLTQSDSDKAENLCVHVEGTNGRGLTRHGGGCGLLDAAGAFDVDMVRELLKAGARADQLYTCEFGERWDIGSYAMQAYMGRARMFPNAGSLWADRCAQILALVVRAGGTCWLSVWLDSSAAPVLASPYLQGITLKGSESWAELLKDLDLPDGADFEDGVLALLEKYGVGA